MNSRLQGWYVHCQNLLGGKWSLFWHSENIKTFADISCNLELEVEHIGAHQNTLLVTQSRQWKAFKLKRKGQGRNAKGVGNLGPKESNIAKRQKGHRETNRETKTYKHKEEQVRGIWYKRNKRKRSTKGRIRVSRYEYACAYMKHACTTQLYTYAYFKYSCACRKHAYAYMPQNPNPEKQERSNLEMKN